MKISDIVRLRDEVVRGDVQGWDRLRGIFELGREADPQYIFGTTYPSAEIKSLLEAVSDKLRGASRKGFFAIMGGYGTGKSRILCLLYHLFKNQVIGREWLKNNGIKLDLPENATVLAFSLLDQPTSYLWEPIFKGLGREDLLKKIEVFPGTSLLKEALADKELTVIIMDELESWCRGVKDRINNLNFIQVLGEVACEEKSNVLVFCALYGEDGELMGRINRVDPYRVNLTLSRDRHRIILFRLIEDVVDRDGLSKIIGAYMKHYHGSEVEIVNPPSYERRMVELYPIHPELMDTLLTRYSSSVNYQNTRGVLCLLASVIAKVYQGIDLLLASDVDMSEPDLLSLDRVLTENAQKDADFIGRDDVRRLLNVILLYSFGEGKGVGASRNDIVLGSLRPGINVNDIDAVLVDLPNMAPHVWIRDDKYVIRHEANIVTLIQNKAIETISRGKIDDALQVIKARLKRELSYLIYHPNSEFSDVIEDDDRLKIVVSLKELSQSEINDFFRGKHFANRLILYIPKRGDITRDEDLLVVAERIRLCDQYEKEVTGENKTLLERQRDRDNKTLRDKLSEIYGYWVRVTGFEKDKINYRLVTCSLDEIRSTVRNSYDVETIRGEILRHLEGNEKGLRVEDIKYDFKTTPGKPIIIVDASFEEALKSLYNQNEIVVEYRGKYLRKPDTLPAFKDEMKIILAKYAPSIEEVIEEEKLGEKPAKAILEKQKPIEVFEKPKVEAVTERIEEEKIKLETIETSTYTSPYLLSTEVERKITENVRVKGITLEFSDASFSDIEALKSFISSLNIRRPKVSGVSLKLIIEGPLGKKETVELIDKLPPALGGGKVKAIIEAERVA